MNVEKLMRLKTSRSYSNLGWDETKISREIPACVIQTYACSVATFDARQTTSIRAYQV